MKLTEWLLLGMAGWSAIGAAGMAISWHRGEREKVRQGVAWLAAVWAVYVCVLLGVSLQQRQRILSIGEPQCFDEMCFTVMAVEEMPGFLIRDGAKLLRVSVQVTNHGRAAQSEPSIEAYLTDAQGRRWRESKGVGGVGLDTRVAGGRTIVSEPVFKVSGDATGLRLIFTHGPYQHREIVIGDSDSLLHRRTVVNLRR